MVNVEIQIKACYVLFILLSAVYFTLIGFSANDFVLRRREYNMLSKFGKKQIFVACTSSNNKIR